MTDRTPPGTCPAPACRRHVADGHLCGRCTSKLREQLAEVPWLYLETRRTALGGARLGEAVGGKSAETGLPVNLQASAVSRNVTDGVGERNGLVGWVRVAVEDCGAPWPEPRISAMCNHLAAWLPALRKHEAVGELVADVRDWTAAMEQAIDRPEVRRIPAGPCPNMADGTPCPGTVFAVFPLDPEQRPHAACSHCADPDAEPMVGVWTAEYWKRLGKAMADRQQEREEARLLALHVGKGGGG